MISIPNCTISYTTVSKTPSSVDPITGEQTFEETATTESFRASLERDTTEPTVQQLPGKDGVRQFYSGKAALKPSQMPSWYRENCKVQLAFDNGFTCDGYVYPANISRLGLDDFFGAPIEISLRF